MADHQLPAEVVRHLDSVITKGTMTRKDLKSVVWKVLLHPGSDPEFCYPDQSPEVLQDDAIDLAIIVVEDPKVKVEVQNVGAMINSTPR